MVHEHKPINLSFRLVDDEHTQLEVTFNDTEPFEGTEFLPPETRMVYDMNSDDVHNSAGFYAISEFINNLVMDRAVIRQQMVEEYLAEHPEKEEELQAHAAEVLLERLARGQVPEFLESFAAQSLTNYYNQDDSPPGSYS